MALLVIDADRIRAAVDLEGAAEMIEAGYVAYSGGAVEMPQAMYLGFPSAPGDCHIKAGHLRGDPLFVIKVATGFYGNPAYGLSSSNGFMVLLSSATGEPVALLKDEGYLTDLRTALAGMIAARHLARPDVRFVGIVGTGIQAEMQALLLQRVFPRMHVLLWGRSPAGRGALAARLVASGLQVDEVDELEDLCWSSELIVTATPSTTPLLQRGWIRPGTHITAVGADAPGKCELAPGLVASIDRCIVDSRAQCIEHGEVAGAIVSGLIDAADLVELGDIISGDAVGRSDAGQITLADLTGLAIQDVQIAKHVWARIVDPERSAESFNNLME